MTTTADLADDLGVDEADVALLLARLTEDDPDLAGGTLSNDTASFIRQLLDPHGERTAPAGLYWPDAEPRPRQTYGLGGPDPTGRDGGNPHS
jgi:hypothetical protein